MSKEKRLAGLTPVSHHVSHMSAIEGCLQYLKISVNTEWLYGLSGYAFLMNIDPGFSVSGPTYWRSECIADHLRNVGIKSTVVSSLFREDPAFVQKQQQAKELIIDSIDKGFPCYCGDFGFPEYFIIHGYNEEGILWRSQYTATDEQKTTWDTLGGTDAKWLIVGNVVPLEIPVVTVDAIRFALSFAVELVDQPTKYSRVGVTGLKAYDSWIDALNSSSSLTSKFMDAEHNANCWSECRSFAGPFLIKASTYMKDPVSGLLKEAAREYAITSNCLSAIAATLKLHKDNQSAGNLIAGVVENLVKAKGAEERAITRIREALSQI